MATLVFCYFLSQFYRNSVGVLGPDLMRELALSPAALGDLGGIFFLAFALAQMPVGVLLDRYGPRRVLAILVCSALIGALLFAFAGSARDLVIGRALMGIGCAPLYMGTLVVLSRWLPPDRFASMAGVVLAIGGLGGIMATTPLALVNEHFGWRVAFAGMAAITAVTAAAVWLVVRDAPPGHPYHARKRETLTAAIAGVREVLAIRRLYFILPINSVAYASLLTVLSLWGAPYLKDVHGIGDVGRGNVLLAVTVAWMAGSVIYGRLDRLLDTRKWLVVGGVVLLILVFGALAVVPPMPVVAIGALLAVLGLAGAVGVVIIAHVRSLFPERLVGRGLTTNNLFGFGGVEDGGVFDR